MEDFWLHFDLVPDVVWAAVIASALTLGGVLLTNRGQNQRLLRQLGHDFDVRDRERRLMVKKEVYLDAAEGISILQRAVGSMADLSIDSSTVAKSISEAEALFQRVYVVGSDQVLKTLSTYAADAAITIVDLLKFRAPLLQRQFQIDLLRDSIANSLEEKDRIVKMMNEANLRGNIDPQYWKTLESNFEFETKHYDEWSKERDKLNEIHFKEQGELLQRCYGEISKLAKVLVPVLAAVREDLQLEFDQTAYEEVLENLAKKSDKAMEELVEAIGRGFDV